MAVMTVGQQNKTTLSFFILFTLSLESGIINQHQPRREIMAEDSVSINEWIKLFDDDAFQSRAVTAQCKAGWYDWFCKDSSLRNKTYSLAPKVKQIAASSKIDCEKSYVFFKNNCPMNGSPYDDFRICDLVTGDVLYTITPRSGHKHLKGKASQVWGLENNFKEPLVVGTWRDVRKFFDV